MMNLDFCTRKEFLWKVVIVGDSSVGKTSIVKRYVHGVFSDYFKQTTGVDFALKVIKMPNDTYIRLQLWDISGKEMYSVSSVNYYTNGEATNGVFVVFDVSHHNTLEATKCWKMHLNKKLPKSVPIILLANKMDLVDDKSNGGPYGGLTKEGMDIFCKDNGFTTWLDISGKTNHNVNEAFNTLIESIIKEKLRPYWYIYWVFKNNMNKDLNVGNDICCNILKIMIRFF